MSALDDFRTAWTATLTALYKRIKDPVNYEAVGDDAKAASPEAAAFAATKFREAATALQNLGRELNAANTTRDGYWKGPASTLFGETMAAFTQYVDDLATHSVLYAKTTEDQLVESHRKAVKDTEAIRADLDRRWQALLKTKGKHVGRGVYRDPDVTVLTPIAQKIYDDGVSQGAAAHVLFSTSLAEARARFTPFPASPNFDEVNRSPDGDKGEDDDPDDKRDAIDDLLDKLGQGPGGGSGGLPDLGGAGGLPELGGGSGLPSGGGGLPGGGSTAPGPLPGLSGGGLPGGAGSSGAGSTGDGGSTQGGLGGNTVTGPDGTTGTDVTGNGVPDIGPTGHLLPGGDLPAGSRVVRRADGSNGIDLTGDGVADVDMRGRAVPGGSAPEGARLVTGPDGTIGYDISGNTVPDLGLDLHPLPDGDLPPDATLVIGPDGAQGIDLNGDGEPDMSLSGRALHGPGAGGQLITGTDGRSGFDTDGDGIPDIDFDGDPMHEIETPSPDPGGVIPGDQVRQSPVGRSSAATPALDPGTAGYPMYPPPMGGMGMGGMGGGGGQEGGGERERQTWLQEEGEVWTDDLMPVAALGRPDDDDDESDDDEVVDEWIEVPVPQPRPGSRVPAAAPPVGWSPASRR